MTYVVFGRWTTAKAVYEPSALSEDECKAAATQSIAYAMFAMHGKIAAFTDNVRGHTKLHTLCTLFWRCSYVAVLFESWLYFETSLRTGMRSRPHAVTCSRQYITCLIFVFPCIIIYGFIRTSLMQIV